MLGLYIGSTTPGAGKSLLTLSLGLLLQKSGLRVGYMKPLGRILQKVEELPGDADALVVQEVLGQNAPADLLTPVMVPPNLRSLYSSAAEGDFKDAADRMEAAYNILSQNRDCMLVSGCGAFPAAGSFCGADGFEVVRRLGLRVLLVERFDGRINYDALLHLKHALGETLAGVVLNDVPEEEMRDAAQVLVPYLAAGGIPVHGIIPREPRLSALRVSELAEGLHGVVAAGNSKARRMVEGFLIGAMQVDNFMMHLRGNKNSAVIAGGDRTDLQLAALLAESPCIILTGNLSPCELIRAKAEEAGVPVITVKEDTYTVARAMARILKAKKLRDLSQIRLGTALAERSLNRASLRAVLGLDLPDPAV